MKRWPGFVVLALLMLKTADRYLGARGAPGRSDEQLAAAPAARHPEVREALARHATPFDVPLSRQSQ